MLINARVPEELRIAIVEGDVLENFQVEVAERGLTRGNIYRGIIASIQPSLNAAFIDYGAERHGFLSIQDVVPAAYYKDPAKNRRPRIEEVLERGRSIVIQVTREPEGTKGAALTTDLSLAGRYLVLTPLDDSEGVSRKVQDEETRRELRDMVDKLERPAGSGIIIRTNALGQNKTALNRDLNALLRLWKRVSTEARKSKGIRLLYSDQDLILRALRDHLDNSVQEVLADSDDAHAKVKDYMRAFMPRSKTQLVRYTERSPLFAKFGLDAQIENIYERQVDLPSGGSIVIDRTEALVAIDVNSGRSTRASSQEDTALGTNMEAANQVARQLRLRDLGGLIVVDFIDMDRRGNRAKVEKAMRDAMKSDKARFTVSRISKNGLLEINRQRIQQALLMRTYRPCPTCDGIGRIASAELIGLRLLRQIEARAAEGFVGSVRAELHPELADAFQNGRRLEIADLEREFELRVEVIASPRLHRSEEEIEWLPRKADGDKSGKSKGTQAATIRDSATQRSSSRSRRRRPAKKSAQRRPTGESDRADTGSESKSQPSAETPPSAPAESDKEGAKRSPSPRRRRSRRSRRPRATTPKPASDD
jgi:ribonuclease E